jgi:hypothetical protein
MDDAALAALRLAVEVSLDEARRELERRRSALDEARDQLADRDRDRGTLIDERSRWDARLRELEGHTLTGAEVLAVRRRGQAIEARLRLAAERHARARAAVSRAAAGLDEARRALGEQLARRRWVEAEARRGCEARASQRDRREDED